MAPWASFGMISKQSNTRNKHLPRTHLYTAAVSWLNDWLVQNSCIRFSPKITKGWKRQLGCPGSSSLQQKAKCHVSRILFTTCPATLERWRRMLGSCCLVTLSKERDAERETKLVSPSSFPPLAPPLVFLPQPHFIFWPTVNIEMRKQKWCCRLVICV